MPLRELLSSPAESIPVPAIRYLSNIVRRTAPNQCGRILKSGKARGHRNVRIFLADLSRRLNMDHCPSTTFRTCAEKSRSRCTRPVRTQSKCSPDRGIYAEFPFLFSARLLTYTPTASECNIPSNSQRWVLPRTSEGGSLTSPRIPKP